MMKKDGYLKPLAVAVTTVALGIAAAYAQDDKQELDEAQTAYQGTESAVDPGSAQVFALPARRT